MNDTKSIKRLLYCGVRLNEEKCDYGITKVKFIDYLFISDVIEIDPSKLSDIKLLENPYLFGRIADIHTVNYVSTFVPNYSAITEPLGKQLL